MIVKIVHYETAGEVLSGERVPQQIVMFDGVDEVEYEKVTCQNAGELRKLAEACGYGNYKWYGQPLPESNEHEDQAGGREALLMRMMRRGVEISLVVISPMVFFMNENGQTVDKVMCR
jgi:hypothetical protein